MVHDGSGEHHRTAYDAIGDGSVIERADIPGHCRSLVRSRGKGENTSASNRTVRSAPSSGAPSGPMPSAYGSPVKRRRPINESGITQAAILDTPDHLAHGSITSTLASTKSRTLRVTTAMSR